MMFGMVAQDEARAKAMEIKQNAEDEATKIRDELLEEARFIGSDSKAEAKLIVRTFPIARTYIHFLMHVCISLSLSRARALSHSPSLKDTTDPQNHVCLCARILLRIAGRCSSEGKGPHRGRCRKRSAVGIQSRATGV